jgi:hypothetical protein
MSILLKICHRIAMDEKEEFPDLRSHYFPLDDIIKALEEKQGSPASVLYHLKNEHGVEFVTFCQDKSLDSYTEGLAQPNVIAEDSYVVFIFYKDGTFDSSVSLCTHKEDDEE